jgi:membrane-bound lytic murein transglycosylase F
LVYSLLKTTLIIIFMGVSLLTCAEETPFSDFSGSLNGKIVVLTRNAPTTYFTDRDGHLSGPEHDMVSAFAREQGFDVTFKVLDTVEEILSELQRGGGDFAAAGLSKTKERSDHFVFGPVYQEIEQQVICQKGNRIRKIKDLIGKDVLVIKKSSYESRLRQLKSKHPKLEWRTTSDLSTEQILHLVWKGEVDCTVADSNIVSIHRRFMPELNVSISLSPKDSLVWLFPKETEILKNSVKPWFSHVTKNGKLKALMEKYYGHVDFFDYYDLKVFKKRIKKRLPKFHQQIKSAAKQHQFPWELLAAISYQESHWDPRAKSPTGVRGFMMLTQTTAASLGVTDRLNPRQSISGGAKYLRRMINRIPEHIQEPDRTWMGLASYNVGFSHLKDARKIAAELNQNPNSWHSVKNALPLLSQKKYYRHLKYGYARGVEPVIYVERIRNYYDILLILEKDFS